MELKIFFLIIINFQAYAKNLVLDSITDNLTNRSIRTSECQTFQNDRWAIIVDNYINKETR
jgi:hypothetical protein